MNNDTPPPVPPRPPGWVSSPVSSPGSGPGSASPFNEAPPSLPPRRPTSEEQPPTLERQSRPYSYVPPSRSSDQSPPLPPRVTRRPVPQREPEPRPQVPPASPASTSSQSRPQFSAPQFQPFQPQQVQAPKFEFNPTNPFQPQTGAAYQYTPPDFEAFRAQAEAQVKAAQAQAQAQALAQYKPPDFETFRAHVEAQVKAQMPNFEAFKTQYTPYQPQAQPQVQTQTSGQSSSLPQPPSAQAQPSSQPQSPPQAQTQQQQQHQQSFPPPPFGPASSTSSSTPHSSPYSAPNLPPHLPPTSPPNNPPPPSGPPPPYNPPPSSSSPAPYDKWTPLFQPNGSPNFIFIAFIKSFFEMLVAQQTPEMRPANGGGIAASGQKLLSPEKCSEFLDVQGFALEHNSWKLNKTPWSSNPSIPGIPNPLAALSPLDKADWEFRLILQAFGIHHIPIPRPRPPPSQRGPPVQTSPFIPSWLTNLMATESQEIPEGMRVLGVGQTPFLTEQGFIKYMALETAGEPDRGFEGLNAALRYYGDQRGGMEGWWRKLGPIPREMFPVTCPAEIQTAVDIGQAKHRSLCQDALDGSRAYHEMAAQGRRNAEELVSDYRYVRVDQYGRRI